VGEIGPPFARAGIEHLHVEHHARKPAESDQHEPKQP
jgi:hypothetical protein